MLESQSSRSTSIIMKFKLSCEKLELNGSESESETEYSNQSIKRCKKDHLYDSLKILEMRLKMSICFLNSIKPGIYQNKEKFSNRLSDLI